MKVNAILDRYKRLRKGRWLSLSFGQRYAFVGIGGHSLSNLYPCLHHLGAPLKYVCTRHKLQAEQMAKRFANCRGTDNLEEVLEDSEVRGVFICANPESHEALSRSVLESGKDLFVEKPPCSTLAELKELSKLARGRVSVVGMQKRYGQVNKQLKRRTAAQAVRTYRMVYGIGRYPEGDALTDLFIHPIDNLLFLFGGCEEVLVRPHPWGYLLLCRHKTGALGQVELSCGYSWQAVQDHLTLHTDSWVYEADYPFHLQGEKKSAVVWGFPTEKMLSRSRKRHIFEENTGKIPLAEQNSLHAQGYFAEIETFLSLCEGRRAENLSPLSSLHETYALLEEIRRVGAR